jgi:hypothetical protein
MASAPVAGNSTGEPLLTPKLALVGAVGGVTSGLLGVGGGILIVPLLVLWAGYTQRDAHAWSLGAIVPIAIAGLIAYGAAGEVRVPEALALALGSIVGAALGAGALARMPERELKIAFGAFLILCAAVMVVQG